MVFDSSLDILISQLSANLEVLRGLFNVKFLKHGLDEAASGQPYFFVDFQAHIVAALAFDFSDIAFSELSEKGPDKMDFFFAVFWKGLTQRFDNSFAFSSLLVDFVENGSQMFVNVFLQNFS
jgi:hypothetical protein